MKIVIEIELGNEAMQTMNDVRDALEESLLGRKGNFSALRRGEESIITDLNGNTVGRWEVVSALDHA